MKIPYGEWLPDIQKLDGGIDLVNAIPGIVGYRSARNLDTGGPGLTSACKGVLSIVDESGSPILYAGDSTKLYRKPSTFFEDSSKVGGYAAGANEFWEFSLSGKRIIAVTANETPQTMLIGGTIFSNLTSVLTAKHVSQGRDFAIMGNTTDSTDGFVPHRIWWSAKGDPTNWTPSVSTQCDRADLVGYGAVQRIVGGEEVVIFQEDCIQIMTYSGIPGEFWRIVPVEPGRGTIAPQSVVRIGRNIFYLGRDGFYVFDGNSSTAIGKGRVDNYFFSSAVLSTINKTTATVDETGTLYLVSYSTNDGSNPTRTLVYNTISNKWGMFQIPLQLIFTEKGSFSNGTRDLLKAFSTTNSLQHFLGAALTAVIKTAEFQLHEMGKSTLTKVVKRSDGVSTMRVYRRDRQADSYVSSGSTSGESNGVFKFRENGRYHFVEETITGGFDQADGIEVSGIKGSPR